MSNKSNPVARAGNTELRDGSRHPGLQTPASGKETLERFSHISSSLTTASNSGAACLV